MDRLEREVIHKCQGQLFRSWLSLKNYPSSDAADMVMSAYKYLCEKEHTYDDKEKKRQYDRKRYAEKTAGEKVVTG